MLADLKKYKKSICSRFVIGALFASVALTACGGLKVVPNEVINTPAPTQTKGSMPIGGYEEYAVNVAERFNLRYGFAAYNDLAKYIYERDQLENTYRSGHGSSCVKRYFEMIKAVGKIENKLAQAQIIQAWVIFNIKYDKAMVARENKGQSAHHNSMLEALETGRGVCDVRAELILNALMKVGYKEDDARFLVLSVYDKGKKQEFGHALVSINVDGRSWFVNCYDKTPKFPKDAIVRHSDITECIRMASRVEPADVGLNISFSSDVYGQENLVPKYSFSVGNQKAGFSSFDNVRIFVYGREGDAASEKFLKEVPSEAHDAGGDPVRLPANFGQASGIQDVLETFCDDGQTIAPPESKLSQFIRHLTFK